MQTFLAILFRCVLAFGLGFTPVANALDMAAMSAPQEDVPPCHAPSQDSQQSADKCCGAAHCHCAMATALPAELPVVAHPIMPSDHPQTVRQLTLQQSVVPDTPPPRA
ncbi:MAG: hypothetical protein H6935_12035 [Thiobacillus sp.]|nr:hypothetical protein [Thiobacillus sp.]